MDDAVEAALETLTKLLNAETEGLRLEAAREILKYSIAKAING